MASQIINKDAIIKKFKIAAKTDSGKIHIVPSLKGWKVKKEGNIRAYGVFETKAQAVSEAKQHYSYKGHLVIHDKNGRVQHLVND